MAATYVLTEPRGKVRLLIPDTNTADAVFSDEELDAFLALNTGSILLAAADAVDAIARDMALVLKVIKTQDLQTDGASLAAELRAHAQGLRDRAEGSQTDDPGSDGGFGITGGFCPASSVPLYGYGTPVFGVGVDPRVYAP